MTRITSAIVVGSLAFFEYFDGHHIAFAILFIGMYFVLGRD